MSKNITDALTLDALRVVLKNNFDHHLGEFLKKNLTNTTDILDAMCEFNKVIMRTNYKIIYHHILNELQEKMVEPKTKDIENEC